MSFSGIVSLYSFNLLFFTQVVTVLSSTIKYNEYITDKGKNITIPCKVDGPMMWSKQMGNKTWVIQTNQVLILNNLTINDAGLYICRILNETVDYDDSLATPSLSSSTEFSSYSFDDYYDYMKSSLIVRTTPGPVTRLYFKPSTILGFLIWNVTQLKNGGYPIRSFTVEYRNTSVNQINETFPQWISLDPKNIAPNVRQMEIYHLLPNTTYEFRIWANNPLGSGDIVTTNTTTLPEIFEEDLVRQIQPEIENFDVRIWIAAVSIVLGALVILAIGLSIVLAKECYDSPSLVDGEDGWDSIELVPNIILNPGFCENDEGVNGGPYTLIFGEDDSSSECNDDDDNYTDEEDKISFKRKVSIFFTGHTIRRI